MGKVILALILAAIICAVVLGAIQLLIFLIPILFIGGLFIVVFALLYGVLNTR